LLAILVTATASILGKMFVPIMSNFNEKIDYIMPVCFIIVGVLIIVVTSQIRETVGVPPPEVILELVDTP
jgi:hypothetical protein